MKKSAINLAVIQNFILHLTHCSDDDRDPGFKEAIELTPEFLYKTALNYIKEDHVDGEDNPEDHIVTLTAESSFSFEDKEQLLPENIVVVADFGDDGTATIATIDSTDLKAIQELLKFVANPKFP